MKDIELWDVWTQAYTDCHREPEEQKAGTE